jgi:hypothetical protein
MSDGIISGNTAFTPASLSPPTLSSSYGGGVYVDRPETLPKRAVLFTAQTPEKA